MYRKIILFFFIVSCIMSCKSTKSPVAAIRKAIITRQPVAKVVKKETKSTPKSKPKNPTTNSKSKETKTILLESTSKTVVSDNVVDNYIAQFKEIAMSNMKTYGVPASIILSQGILESGAGRGDLAVEANNHFGIKCHSDWTGASVKHNDDTLQECFRKYEDPAESYKDHALFLTGRTRYADLFALPKSDYESWAKGLRAAGYATDPKYPDKLISCIKRYHLDQYDAQVLGIEYTLPEAELDYLKRPENYYEVQKGDTLYSISKKTNLAVEELKKKNNMTENTLSIGQKLIVK